MSSAPGRHRAEPLRRSALFATLLAIPPLTLALTTSLALHAVLLSIHFKLPEALMKASENALDVVLVNSRHAHKPTHAQAYAQANLDGGGNSEADQRASTPLPPSADTREGDDVVQAQRRVAAMEAQQREIMTRLKSNAAAQSALKRDEPTPPTPLPPTISGLDLANRALAVARLEAQIEREMNQYNKRPRIKNIGARTEEYRFAQYVEDWRQKIERIGNLNYPEAAKGRWYGSLTLTVIIKSSGELQDVEINRSSGIPLLDEAAKRIVRMSAPYGAFPDDIKRDTDVLTITRKWSFTHDDMLQSQ